MEFSEHDTPSTDDESFYSSTTSANPHWYYYWSPHIESGLYYPLINESGSAHRSQSVDQPQLGNYFTYPTSSSLIWDPHSQGLADYQSNRGNALCFPPQVPSEIILPTTIDRRCQHNEPYLISWTSDLATFPQTDNSSRRPSFHSHASDPGLSAISHHDCTHQFHPDLRPNSGSDVVATSRTDLQATEQANSPSTEPSPSAGLSSVGGNVVRPVIRCYDHGCDGRTFSSISNYRRHQRERAGRSPVCFCPRCGAAFYRRWTRDHHVERGSCLRIARWN